MRKININSKYPHDLNIICDAFFQRKKVINFNKFRRHIDTIICIGANMEIVSFFSYGKHVKTIVRYPIFI